MSMLEDSKDLSGCPCCGRQDWKPIDTAPKDGTWVLLLTGHGFTGHRFTGHSVEAGYYAGAYFGGKPYLWLQYDHRSEWLEVVGIPTHWMPFPDPPEPTPEASDVINQPA